MPGDGADSSDVAIVMRLDAGWSRYYHSRYRAALAAADAVLKTAPENADAWLLRCATLRMQQRWKGVLTAAAQVERLAPHEPTALGEALLSKGDALDALGRYSDALVAFRHALTVLPTEDVALRVLVWIGVSRCQGNLNHASEALAAVQRAIEIDPPAAEVWYRLGESYRARRRMPEALAALEQTLALDPDHPYAGSNRAWVLLRLGRWREAWRAVGQVRANFSAISLRIDERLFGRARVDEPSE